MKTKSKELAPLQVTPEQVAEVNAMHQRACDGAAFKEATIAHVNEVRQIGLVLIGIKDSLKHGQWLALFDGKNAAGCAFAFGVRSAQDYMRLAKKLPEPVCTLPDAVRCVKDFMRWTGTLPASRGPGASRGDAGPFAALMRGVQEITRTVGAWKDRSPVNEWPMEKRQQTIDQLRPIVDFYEELSALEARRA